MKRGCVSSQVSHSWCPNYSHYLSHRTIVVDKILVYCSYSQLRRITKRDYIDPIIAATFLLLAQYRRNWLVRLSVFQCRIVNVFWWVSYIDFFLVHYSLCLLTTSPNCDSASCIDIHLSLCMLVVIPSSLTRAVTHLRLLARLRLWK